MRNPSDVLREKMEQYKQVVKEIDALRLVIPLLHEPELAKGPNSHES